MATKLGRMMANLGGLLPIKSYESLIRWFCKITKSFYLHYHSAYRHQTRQYGDLPWDAINHRITQRSDYVLLQSYVTKENRYISITAVPMVTKQYWVVTYLDSKFLPFK